MESIRRLLSFTPFALSFAPGGLLRFIKLTRNTSTHPGHTLLLGEHQAWDGRAGKRWTEDHQSPESVPKSPPDHGQVTILAGPHLHTQVAVAAILRAVP